MATATKEAAKIETTTAKSTSTPAERFALAIRMKSAYAAAIAPVRQAVVTLTNDCQSASLQLSKGQCNEREVHSAELKRDAMQAVLTELEQSRAKWATVADENREAAKQH